MNQPAPVAIAPVAPADLVPVINHAMQCVAHIQRFEDAMRPYLKAVGEITQNRARSDATALTLRAALVLQVMSFDREILLAENVLFKSSADSKEVLVTSAFIAAVSKVPLRIAFKEGMFAPLYEVRDLIEIARKENGESPRRVALGGNPTFADHHLSPELSREAEQMFDSLKDGETIESKLANMAAYPVPEFPPSEYPRYEKMKVYRAGLLGALSSDQRAVYEVERFSDTHDMVRAMSNMLGSVASGGKKVKATLSRVMGYGPWAFYPLLDQAPGWNYPRFLSVALQSSLTASIPCMNGCLPAYYVGRYGTDDDFARVLNLFPSAARSIDAADRPLIVDIANFNNAENKMMMLLNLGADPQSALPSGVSAMKTCLSTLKPRAALALIKVGYRAERDAQMDARVIDGALASPVFQGEIRSLLFRMRSKVPEVSSVSAQLKSEESASKSRPTAWRSRKGYH